MAVEIQDYPVIDNHCHPFPIGRIPHNIERMWTLSLNQIPATDIKNSMIYQMMVREMRIFHHLDPRTPLPDVVQYCHQKYLQDPQGYTADLWKDAVIEMIIGDIGSGVKKDSIRLTEDEIDEFDELNQSIDVGKINRIEFFTDDIIAQGVPFLDFTDCFIEHAQAEIIRHGLIALKSIIAYRTGLEVIPRPVQEVHVAYDRYLKDHDDIEAEKVVRDYVFLTAAKFCSELDIPLQVHAGAGDSPVCDLRQHDPILLYQAINDPRVVDTRLILLHASYPTVEHAAYLAGQYANIYVDVSMMVPYLGHAVDHKLSEMLEVVPYSKLLYGSDGSIMPDFIWYAAKRFKQALQNTLNAFILAGYIDDDFASHAAKLVLSDNVKRIYKLN